MANYASIVPLIGGETIAMQNVFGSRPEYILSYDGFEENDKHLVEYYKGEVPYHLIQALVLGLVVLALQVALMLLLMIGCAPVHVTYSAVYGPRYFGEKMHHDSLLKWESRLLKIFERSQEKTDTLFQFIKQKVSFMVFHR